MTSGKTPFSGKSLTVLGEIDPKDMGVTLIHEHLFNDCSFYYKVPDREDERHLKDEPVSFENVFKVRRSPSACLDNMRLDDEALAIKEVSRFATSGGRTVVDVTNHGLARNPEGLVRIAKATGLNIIMGSGYYLKQSHGPSLSARTEKDIEDEIVRDVLEGVDGTGIRAGIIGELGCNWPLDPTERKVLQAGAKAQARTGAPLCVHIGRHHQSPIELALILKDNGANMRKVSMCHLDRDAPPYSTLHTLADMGCYFEFDLIGQETFDYPYVYLDRLTDWQRVHVIRDMIAEGLIDNILLSHDIGHKHRLTKFGGHGYAHISDVTVPLMKRKGITDEQIQHILVANPARLMAFE
jgi:phosphotriesterase-related protein